MRRLWVVLAVTMVATALTANGVASAHTSGAVASVSCASLAKRYEKGNSSASSINFGNPQSLDAAFHNAAKTFNSLANSAPSSLRPAFRALANLYAHLTSVNLSNPSSLSAARVDRDHLRQGLRGDCPLLRQEVRCHHPVAERRHRHLDSVAARVTEVIPTLARRFPPVRRRRRPSAAPWERRMLRVRRDGAGRAAG